MKFMRSFNLSKQDSDSPLSPINIFLLRSVSWVLDLLFIFVLGGGLFYPLSDQMIKLWPWGWAPIMIIHTLYFGILESSVGKGASFGKKVFGLKVYHQEVRGELSSTPCWKSILRGALFSLFWLLPLFPNFAFGSQKLILASMVTLVFMLTALSGLVDPLGRTLHDRLFSNWVMPSTSTDLVSTPIPSKKVFNLGLILGGLVSGIAFFFSSSQSPLKLPKSQDLLSMQEKLRQDLKDGSLQISRIDGVLGLTEGSVIHIKSSQLLPWDGNTISRRASLIIEAARKHMSATETANIQISFDCEKFLGLVPSLKDCGVKDMID